MVAAKPEVHVSQHLRDILTKFQRLPPHNRGPAFQWSRCEYSYMKPEAIAPTYLSDECHLSSSLGTRTMRSSVSRHVYLAAHITNTVIVVLPLPALVCGTVCH